MRPTRERGIPVRKRGENCATNLGKYRRKHSVQKKMVK